MLIDSGCDSNILPKRFAKNVKLDLSDQSFVTVANGSKVEILGSAFMTFFLNGQKLRERFLVANDIDECILGFSFLKNHRCVWNFDSACIDINGKSIKLKQRAGKSSERRMYVRENVHVPKNSYKNVPVRMPYSNLYNPTADWLSDAKSLRPGLFLARTLLPESDELAALCAVNVSGKDQFLRRDLSLGEASPGICVTGSAPVNVLVEPYTRNEQNQCTVREIVTTSPLSQNLRCHPHTTTPI